MLTKRQVASRKRLLSKTDEAETNHCNKEIVANYLATQSYCSGIEATDLGFLARTIAEMNAILYEEFFGVAGHVGHSEWVKGWFGKNPEQERDKPLCVAFMTYYLERGWHPGINGGANDEGGEFFVGTDPANGIWRCFWRRKAGDPLWNIAYFGSEKALKDFIADIKTEDCEVGDVLQLR